MTYQLVLQWRGDQRPDFDGIVRLEELLIHKLGSAGDVDGHDSGDDESNIFIVTEAPEKCLEKIVKTVGIDLIRAVHVGFRKVGEDCHAPLWPKSLMSFKVT